MGNRVMAFVDGENLLTRFEAMRAEGHKPRDFTPEGGMTEKIKYEPNQYVWSPYTVNSLYMGDVLERVSYYSTFIGDTDAVEALNTSLGECVTRDTPFASTPRGNTSFAFFRKSSRKRHARQRPSPSILVFAWMLWNT